MKVHIKACVLACAVALVGCAPSPERIEAASFTLSETNQPVQMFSEACLETLPNFNGFQNVVKKRDLTPARQKGGLTAYKAPGEKLLTVTSADIGDKSACGVGFLGSADSSEIGAMFFREATKRTGGKPREKFPSSRFAYAYHLRNGSVMTYEVQQKSGQIRHIVLISKPATREEVSEYIYD
ncbi:hypothetical protein [Ruegeria sp.]|uniref:hypothetical protein n=1 Tax=Ruegeria sp. TaxID=1879320 RepID=UPI002310D1E8|nr:hypothetical protein [Ruegeria sp.]MDA7966101.1 hypothetical protein [Ruegeria sp.]